MQFWLSAKAKELHQYNMLAFPSWRREWDEGSTEVCENHIDPAVHQEYGCFVIFMLVYVAAF